MTKVTITVQCDGCRKELKVPGKILGHRNKTVIARNVYAVALPESLAQFCGLEDSEAISIQMGVDTDDLGEESWYPKVACSPACVGKIVTDFLSRSGKRPARTKYGQFKTKGRRPRL